MATYADLADDIRLLVPEFTAAEYIDSDVTRLIYRAILKLVTKAATVAPNHHLMPQGADDAAIPADLTDGFTLPTDVLRLRRVEIHHSDDTRQFANIVPEGSRNDAVRPTPAAYVDPDGTLYPIPGDGRVVWSHAAIQQSGWRNLANVYIEYISLPTDPGATGSGSDTGVHVLFEDAGLLWAASRIARGLQSNRFRDLLEDYDDATDELLGTFGMGMVGAAQQRVREVY